MERRKMLADGCRYLARVLPAMIATAGSLGVLLRQPVETVVDSPPGCFPAQTEAIDRQTSISRRKEE